MSPPGPPEDEVPTAPHSCCIAPTSFPRRTSLGDEAYRSPRSNARCSTSALSSTRARCTSASSVRCACASHISTGWCCGTCNSVDEVDPAARRYELLSTASMPMSRSSNPTSRRCCSDSSSMQTSPGPHCSIGCPSMERPTGSTWRMRTYGSPSKPTVSQRTAVAPPSSTIELAGTTWCSTVGRSCSSPGARSALDQSGSPNRFELRSTDPSPGVGDRDRSLVIRRHIRSQNHRSSRPRAAGWPAVRG